MKYRLQGTRPSRIGWFAGIALLSLSGAWNAEAAVIAQTQDINLLFNVTMSTSLTNTPLPVTATASKTLLFDEFDPSLGTLDEVHIDVDSAGTTSGTLELTTGGQPQASASFQLSDTERVAFSIPSLFSVTATYTPVIPLSVGFTSTSDNTLTFSTSHPTFLGVGLSGATFTPFFTGTDTFGIDFSLMISSVLTLLEGANATLRFMAAWDPLTDAPAVTVSYVYTPAQVSEPGTLALLLFSLVAALPLARRRITRNSANVKKAL